jgi:ABC-type multidrug transport system fused ATPase/permease subunit
MNWMIMFLAMAVVAAVLLVMYLVTSTNLDIANKRIRSLESDASWLKSEANHFQVKYVESTDEIKRLTEQVADMKNRITRKDQSMLDQHREVIRLKQAVRTLDSRLMPRSKQSLIDAMKDISRFIGANTWMMDEDTELAEVVASVGEVADSIVEGNGT